MCDMNFNSRYFKDTKKFDRQIRSVLSDEEIEKTVHSILDSFGTDNFILGADCTLSTDQDLSKVRAAVRALENYR